MSGRPCRSGGRIVDAYAKVVVRIGPNRWEPEGRVVMAASLGRPLRRSEYVCHRNGDPSDNRIENLYIQVRRDRRVNVLVPCACGCGLRRRMFGSDGRRRRFIHGHGNRGLVAIAKEGA